MDFSSFLYLFCVLRLFFDVNKAVHFKAYVYEMLHFLVALPFT